MSNSRNENNLKLDRKQNKTKQKKKNGKFVSSCCDKTFNDSDKFTIRKCSARVCDPTNDKVHNENEY